jgi:type I restriction enzyme M protein
MDDLQATLWKAADKLRGSMDAAQYKDFVLSLVFLKSALAGARWDELAALAARQAAGGQVIGEALDAAAGAVMAANAGLAGALPPIFGRDGVDQRRLGELVTLVAAAPFGGAAGRGQAPGARDVLGEVYEYFLDKFARAEGRRGGEFYTPAGVVALLVEVLEPYAGVVYDPCCGSGGMFTQAEKFLRAHASPAGHRAGIAVYGQELNERTWRLARMNLAIHGISGDLGGRPADTFGADQHPGLEADFIMANPPFNMSDWARQAADQRWRYGVPPAGNANFAWLQHIVAAMGSGAAAGVILANGSMSSRQSGEGAIRAALVEADLVACMIALPDRLFRSTQIPACLWLLARDKGARSQEVLFIDARRMGTLVDRAERVLTGGDIAAIAGTYHAWRGTASARAAGRQYADVAGLCYSASLSQVREHEHILVPGRYVGAPPDPDGDQGAPGDKVARLTEELLASLDETARLAQAVRQQLQGR